MRWACIDYVSRKNTCEERSLTWQNPDTPATDSKLNALTRNVSNEAASVCSFGGGPGTVGMASTSASYAIMQKKTKNKKLRMLKSASTAV